MAGVMGLTVSRGFSERNNDKNRNKSTMNATTRMSMHEEPSEHHIDLKELERLRLRELLATTELKDPCKVPAVPRDSAMIRHARL